MQGRPGAARPAPFCPLPGGGLSWHGGEPKIGLQCTIIGKNGGRRKYENFDQSLAPGKEPCVLLLQFQQKVQSLEGGILH